MRDLPPAFERLLREQHGCFTRRQANSHGVSDAAIRASLAARRWQRACTGVYLDVTGPPDDLHRAWIAVLAAGPDAALSHESAAHRHGIIRAAPPVTHVLTPYAASPSDVPGVVYHRSRRPHRTSGAPPTVDVADTLCDLSQQGWGPDRMAAVVSSALRGRLTTPEEVRATIKARGRFPGIKELRGLVNDVALGAHSALEVRYLRHVERAHRLPSARRQARSAAGGTTTYRDVHYVEQRVVVELDGREHHGAFSARLRDARRDRLAAGEGLLTLRYTWSDVVTEPCAVAREVYGVLHARGWRRPPRSCPSCERSSWL